MEASVFQVICPSFALAVAKDVDTWLYVVAFALLGLASCLRALMMSLLNSRLYRWRPFWGRESRRREGGAVTQDRPFVPYLCTDIASGNRAGTTDRRLGRRMCSVRSRLP